MQTINLPEATTDRDQAAQELRDRLDGLFDALVILSPISFRLADEPPVVLDAKSNSTADHPLVETLWPVLYVRAYTRIFAPADATSATNLTRTEPPDLALVNRLSTALRTRRRLDHGWTVYQAGPDGSIQVQKGEACRVVLAGQYVFADDLSRRPRVGELVDLLVARESRIVQPGFYLALGGSLGCGLDEAHVARFYFHATAEGMPGLLGELSGRLNRYQVPFRLKCHDNLAGYGRSDAAVLFVAVRFLTIVLRLIEELASLLDDCLKPDVPLFTRALRPGLGVADNPGGTQSFGETRCRLLAGAILDAWLTARQDREARHQALADRFARAGLSLTHPHLNAGSADLYHWPAGDRWKVGRSSR